MARLAICLSVVVLLCQTVSVFSRQVDFGDLDFGNVNNNNNQPPQTSTAAPTTTTPSPRYRACIERCPMLPQYNPVCGTDGVSYSNRGRLDCAKDCGTNVQLSHVGTCGVSAGGK